MLPGTMAGAKVLRALARFGWSVARVSGSHRILRHVSGRTLVVAFHGELSRISVRRLLRDAGIPENEFLAEL